jgi:F-type H+-transporting ATPase subunit delta
MSQLKIASRYAKSLIDLASETNQLDKVYEDILTIQSACQNKEFQLMLKSPVVTSDKKEKIFEALFGGKVAGLVHSFIVLLASKGREPLLGSICQAFISQYKSIRKIRTAVLITPSAQSAEQLEYFRQKFQDWLKPGESMEIVTRLDPKLIGGFIFQMDGRQVDSTAKRKLDAFRNNLYDSSYTNLVVKS